MSLCTWLFIYLFIINYLNYSFIRMYFEIM